jgi:hypothetical protein
MQRQSHTDFYPYQFGEAALAASRKIWLAGLGATVVSRDWMQSEAVHVFRTLVKEGTVVESRAFRFVGGQVETSVTRANSMWKQTRRTVEAKVRQAASSVVDYAQQVLPRSLPKLGLPKAFVSVEKAAKPVKRAKKAVKVRPGRPAKKAKRTTKRG